MIRTFTIAILIFSCISTSAQDIGRIKLSNLIVLINVGNIIILRSQLSLKFRLSKLNHIEVTSGYITQNKSLQNSTVSFFNEDDFLSRGFHFWHGLKKMIALNFHKYFSIQSYFKKFGDNNDLWHNRPKIDEE